MGFWAGFSETFKPLELVKAFVTINEERLQEQKKLNLMAEEEAKKRAEAEAQSRALIQSYNQSLDLRQKAMQTYIGSESLFDYSTQKIDASKMPVGALYNPSVIQTLISNNERALGIAEESFKSYMKGKLEPDEEVITTRADDAGNWYSYVKNKKTGQFYAKVILDQNNNPLKLVVRDPNAMIITPKQLEEYRNYAISNAEEIAGTSSTDARSAAWGKLALSALNLGNYVKLNDQDEAKVDEIVKKHTGKNYVDPLEVLSEIKSYGSGNDRTRLANLYARAAQKIIMSGKVTAVK